MSDRTEKLIETFENQSVDYNDLQRAIRFNWLRNAYKTGQYDDDDIVSLIQKIKYNEPGAWPALQY